MIQTDKPAIVIVLETKVKESLVENLVRRLGFEGSSVCCHPSGSAGGLWILWDAKEVQIDLVHQASNLLQFEFLRRGWPSI